MGIHVFEGIFRSGKGIGATLVAFNHARAEYLILSNMDFFFSNVPGKRTNLPIDWDTLESCVANAIPLKTKYSAKKVLVVIDELMTQMDSRKALSNSNVGLSYLATQAAKTHTAILGTSQLHDAMDVRMRTFTQWRTYCNKLLYSTWYNGKWINNAIEAFQYFVYNNQYAKPRLTSSYEIDPQTAYWLGQRFSTEQPIAPKALQKKYEK